MRIHSKHFSFFLCTHIYIYLFTSTKKQAGLHENLWGSYYLVLSEICFPKLYRYVCISIGVSRISSCSQKFYTTWFSNADLYLELLSISISFYPLQVNFLRTWKNRYRKCIYLLHHEAILQVSYKNLCSTKVEKKIQLMQRLQIQLPLCVLFQWVQ